MEEGEKGDEKGKREGKREREEAGSEYDKANLHRPGGLPRGRRRRAQAAAFSSAAPAVAMATRALAIPSDIKMPPPARSWGASAGGWKMCAHTHACPPRGRAAEAPFRL